ncbi:MAG TPA: ECF transporter S component [Clostridia bacterium]|jgi:thiamine transporter ThiT|nr:ECF transporter S component [Clostridiaceae bacterium]HOM35307.1 ECF transporter S component [Clostridia bacterium]HQG01143.1 ECF transporter S component [Clostridia bacterium]HQH66536.1 ECF transporter S component [Clostridia bacterium]HQJ93125.1 ECF transporter S component [Clostridia bacterium]
MEKNVVKNIALTGMFIALGIVLPFLTGQIPEIGSMLLPMHIPIMLCGLVLGWKYGAIAGFITPLLRSLIFGMPPLYPAAIAMAFELAVYGLVIGLIFSKVKWKCIYTILFSLAVSMIAGRIVWGLAMYVLLAIGGGSFTFAMFLAGAFVNAVPGIVLQFVLIPTVMLLLNRAGVVQLTKKHERHTSEENGEVQEG